MMYRGFALIMFRMFVIGFVAANRCCPPQFYVGAASTPDPATTATTSTANQFTLGIRDSFMIAHSFHHHPAFGPAGGMHGATYTCDVEFSTDHLQPEVNWVMDIGDASALLSQVLERYNFKNLDELFGTGVMTTTEFMCRQIHKDLCEKLKEAQCRLNPNTELCVKLWESHKAWASYTAPVLL
jgi:6-pyruvoyltetrahydropterin/6-carboxytetrahydropterin synthase